MAAGEQEVVDGTLSMREKALMKRRINKQHNSNFKAGYVPISESYLHKTGLRGRKSFLVYGIVLVLFLITLGNLLVTMVLLSVLRIGYGMEGLEFIPSGQLLKFLVPSDFETIIPVDGRVGGFANHDLDIMGSNGEELELRTNSPNPSTLTLRPDGMLVSNVDNFQVINPNNGKTVFSSDYSGFSLPVSVKSLNVQKARVNRISSPVDKPLSITSEKQIKFTGSEGIFMSSRELVWSAQQNLILKTVNGSIRLNGTHGIFITMKKRPIINEPYESYNRQYKICVCSRNRRLFRIPIHNTNYNCANAVVSGKISPCL